MIRPGSNHQQDRRQRDLVAHSAPRSSGGSAPQHVFDLQHERDSHTKDERDSRGKPTPKQAASSRPTAPGCRRRGRRPPARGGCPAPSATPAAAPPAREHSARHASISPSARPRPRRPRRRTDRSSRRSGSRWSSTRSSTPLRNPPRDRSDRARSAARPRSRDRRSARLRWRAVARRAGDLVEVAVRAHQHEQLVDIGRVDALDRIRAHRGHVTAVRRCGG